MQLWVNDRYITALFIKTKVIFAFILLKEKYASTLLTIKIKRCLSVHWYLHSEVTVLQIRAGQQSITKGFLEKCCS